MPFASDKQRRYLYSQKPEVAKKFAAHKANGGPISTHWANGKPKSKDQLAYEARVKESNANLRAGPLGAIAETAAGFVPGVGEAMDAKDAYDAWTAGDYLTAAGIAGVGALGLVPGVGDAVATGARAARRAAPLAGTALKHLDKDYADLALDELRGIDRPARSVGASARFEEPVSGLTRKEEVAAQAFDKQFPGKGRNIVADIKREHGDPSVAIDRNLGDSQVIRPRSGGTTRPRQGPHGTVPPGEGGWEQQWRAYDTPDGKTVSATLDHKGNVVNALDVPGRPQTAPLGDHREFSVVTKDMAAAGHPQGYTKISDAIKHPGALAPKAPKPKLNPALANQLGADGKIKAGAPEGLANILRNMGYS